MSDIAGGREMTVDELFEAALTARVRQLEDTAAARVKDFTAWAKAAEELPVDDVVRRSMLADHAAHRRADEKLNRLLDKTKDFRFELAEGMRLRQIQDESFMHRGIVYLLGVITGGLGVLVLRLLGI